MNKRNKSAILLVAHAQVDEKKDIHLHKFLGQNVTIQGQSGDLLSNFEACR